MKILIIDDEESIRDSLRWHLESFGYKVVTLAEPILCGSCNERINNMDCHDVLIVDYNLPNMNGLDYIEFAEKENCQIKGAKKILISARTDWIDTDRARLLGCLVEQKPITLERITELIAA